MFRWTKRYAALIVFIPAIMALPGGAAPEPSDSQARLEKVVAQVGDTKITIGDIEERLGKHMRPGMFEDQQKLTELVDAMVDRELLVMEARTRGLDKNKRVVGHEKRILYNQIQTKYVADEMPLTSIAMDEIEKYYEEHFEEYNQPTLVRAYHIVVADEAEAKTLFDQVKAEGMDLRKFKVLAGEKSQDPETKKRGGDLRYFNAEGKVWTAEEVVPLELATAAFKVEILVRASLIVTDDQEAAREALGKCMMPGLTDAQYRKLAAKYNKPELGLGGDTPLFDLDGLFEGVDGKLATDLTRAAFSLREAQTTYPKVLPVDGKYYVLRVIERKDPGNLYPEVVKTSQGFHVLWVVNRRPSVEKTVQEMEPSIRQRIWQDKKKDFMTKLIADLKAKYKVEVNEKSLDKVKIDLSGQAAPSAAPATPGQPPVPVAPVAAPPPPAAP